PVWIGIAFALSLVYQFFIHTTLIGKLHPALEYIFNTPSHHRVHHGRNPGYIDRNYGGVLIIWDRLFHTFAAEDKLEPPEYGVTTPVHRQDLITLWTHEYVDLFYDMKHSASLSEALKRL
ncbi:sterol desaturase family protein, partial [Arthrospira platensis SPKY1]|nr:sterol desaturase family protein [Arthrospira platensis SPKY1]